ncbi:hypothetical protein VTN00DRAFT_208 [Thermoascus crustaceus]|uniref:uncharacterized protein n=1 Tax=Thermoascus crustaceus TaxID=5088 RepID=UPI00374486AB
MGQTSSTQRDQRRGNSAQFSLLPQELNNGDDGGVNNEDMAEHSGRHNSPPSAGDETNTNTINNSASEQPAFSQPNMWQSSTIPAAGQAESEQTRAYEQHNRPFVEVGYPDNRASLARLTGRRQSTMSRLGSRILPNSVIRGLLNSEEETPAEGHAHRNGILSRSMSRSEGTSSRFSLGSRGITRRRSIRGPYPLPRGDAALMPDSPPNPTYLDSSNEQVSDSGRGTWRRSARRLSRVRNSLSTPISQIFGQPSPPPSSQAPRTPPRRPSRSTFPEDSDHFLPSLGSMDTRMDYDTPHELDSVEPAMRNPRPVSPMSSSSRPSQGMNGVRRLPGVLRARSSRMLRRDEQTPLSRVLQLAAAAIAAQLSGTAGPALPNVQSLGNDGLDGSLENFIQSLQHVTSTHANASGADGAQNSARDVDPPPVNFLRVFRFVNNENPANSTAHERPTSQSDEQGSRTDRMDIDEPSGEGTDGRTVTLVVVGVRFSPRRHFMEGTNPLTSNDSQHEQGASNISRRPSEASPSSGLSSSLPTVLSESPPGPHPPPSTPAGLSAVSSGATTPSRRPSSASAISPSIPPQLPEDPQRQPEPAENTPFNTARQRRRSDSEFARHRDLGSGAARRNGVVEPDNAPPSGGRSWLIYVVGTNLSENHPAFATPSLFTDNPTYEDMLLLSSLLGPAKPPVASQEDVSSAGGLFRLVEYAGSLVAEALDGAETIQIPENERCLICLSDYEAAEEVRQLAKCKHIYHKDCIDEWLTTGRNSCPLCRGQGVSESSNHPNSNPTPEVAA